MTYLEAIQSDPIPLILTIFIIVICWFPIDKNKKIK